MVQLENMGGFLFSYHVILPLWFSHPLIHSYEVIFCEMYQLEMRTLNHCEEILYDVGVDIFVIYSVIYTIFV